MLNKSILLVDYEPKGLSSLKSYLEGLGFAVDTATDGSMALARFFESKPDMVVMSPMLPKIHGFDVCRQITQSPEGKDIPVIIITAVYKGSKYRNEAIHSCGARAYFEKPYAEEELTDTIYKLLNIRKDKAPAQAPQVVRAATPSREKSLEDMLPELKSDRTMPFIKKSDVFASLQLEKQKHKAEETPKPAAATQPPQQDEKFVTSEDIFGDVIESFEVGKKAAPAAPAAPKPEPPPPTPAVKPAPVPEQVPIVTVQLPSPAKIEAPAVPATTVTFESLDELAKVDRTVKKAAQIAAAKKEAGAAADIERKLEETLSGLSLDFGKPKAPRAPAAPPKPVAAPKKVAAPAEVAPTPIAPPPVAAPSVVVPPVVVAPVGVPAEVVPPVVVPPAVVPPAVVPPAVVTPPPKPAPFVPPPVAKPAPAPQKVAPPQPVVAQVPVPAIEPVKAAPLPPEPKPQPVHREERVAMPVKYGEYVLLEKIATGGMAELFKAKRSGPEGFEKILAIKRILPHLSDNEEFVTMFIDEAKVAAQLNHPNIVHIYDLGKIEDSYFIAMEYVLGKDLRTLIKELDRHNRTLPYELAAYVGIKICEALEYAHRKLDYGQKPLNIVHRDVSPQNILISYEGEVKLVDFGVAKAASKAHHTTHGALKGKILYMSPEQAWGKSIDHRSDLFSLGSVVFEMSTGRKLFLGDSEISTLEAVRNGKVIPPSTLKRDFPKPLEESIVKALKLKADDRYGSASEMQKALESCLDSMHMRPSTTSVSEFMFELFGEEMKAKGIRFEPRKAAAPKPHEPVVRVEKPEVRVPPPKVIAVEKPVVTAPAAAVKEPAPAVAAAAPAARPPDVDFKPMLDTAVHTEYRQARSRRMGIVGIIAAIALVAAGIFYWRSRTTESAPPVVPTPPPGQTAPPGAQTPPTTLPSQTTPTPGVTTPGQQTPPAVLDPAAQAAEKKRLEDEQRRREEDRQKLAAQQEADRLKKQQEDEAAKAEETRLAELKKQEDAAAATAAEAERKRLEDEARKKAEDERVRLEQQQKAAKQAEVKEGDIVPINQVDTPPVAVTRPSPVYPDVAKRSGVAGTVRLSILVSETGSVVDVKVLSETGGKLGLLNEAASSAVKRWKYQPATRSGKKVKVWLNVSIPFTLH
ncbi:MAG: TonB family protein [Acidobacteria bacterium]|nr:TonB family protein [Acidobacteriota bacterium]